jgi:photosystem II stability/assembly factor-like uncharacterized protein
MKSRSAVIGWPALLVAAPALLFGLSLPLAARMTPVATTKPAAPATVPEAAPAEPAAAATVDAAAPAPAEAGGPATAALDTAGTDDPSAQMSEKMPRASKSLLLDIVRTASGFVAVGERGHVLHSDDGRTWAQLVVPTRSALTSIATADGQLWVGGHDGVILHSTDGGQTWKAQRRDPFRLAQGESAADHDPRQGAPILDIWFRDASNGIAVGAHSLMLVTSDGGATWTEKQAIAGGGEPRAAAAPSQGDLFSAADLELEDEADPHFNAIAPLGEHTLVIVGERGTLLRSEDDGANWKRLPFPYKGSMFGVLPIGADQLLAFGLRGNVYESKDGGSSWSKLDTQASVSLMGGALLEGGGVVLAGANGTVLRRAGADAPFTLATFHNAAGETPALAGILPDGRGDFVIVGDKGADTYHPQ